MSNRTLVFSQPGHEALASRLAAALQAPVGTLTLRAFPDAETYARVETPREDVDVVLAANLYRPNAQLLPLMYAVRGLRLLGARRVYLASPYLPHMRQDASFQRGEVVTSRIFAQLLSNVVDGLVTVDPHLHRYATLGEIYSVPTQVAHAASMIADWIIGNVKRPLIVGPDSESEQWVSEVADMAGAPCIVFSKIRRGDRDVEIAAPPLDSWRKHTPVLVDDIISTAHTMIQTVGHLTNVGYAGPICIAVHGVFAGDAYEALYTAGATDVITCNTVVHPSNSIDLTDLLADGIRALFAASTASPIERNAT